MDDILSEVTNCYSIPEMLEAYGFDLAEEKYSGETLQRESYIKDNVTVTINYAK